LNHPGTAGRESSKVSSVERLDCVRTFPFADSEQFDEREENSLSQRTSAKCAETDTMSFDDDVDHSSKKRTRDNDDGTDTSEDEQRHEVIITRDSQASFHTSVEGPKSEHKNNNKIER
jgi:hypothetical protein